MTEMIKALSELTPWDKNYNFGDLGAIATSLAKFGYNRSISVWRDGEIRAGNHTFKALCWLKKQKAQPPVNVEARNGDWYIETTDCSHLTPEQATAYAIADNRTVELASHDDEKLAELLSSVAEFDTELFESTGYDEESLGAIISAFTIPFTETWQDALDTLPSGDRQPFQQITFTLHDSQMETVGQAIKTAKANGLKPDVNENSNGNALEYICGAFLNGEG